MQATHNPTASKIREEMTQMRTELELVFKQVAGDEKKVNVVNYLTKPPPPVDDYYYEEDFYKVNEQMGGFRPNAQGSIRRNGAKVKKIKIGTMGIITEWDIIFDMETTTRITTSIVVIMVTETIEVGSMFCLKIEKLLLWIIGVVWHEFKICYKR